MLLSELRMLVLNLRVGVEQDAGFFSGILGYARHLADLEYSRFDQEQLHQAGVAIAQIQAFFATFDDSGSGTEFYLEPPQTRDLRPTVSRIGEIVQELAKLDPADLGGERNASKTIPQPVVSEPDTNDMRRVFVVHGHDKGPREAVARVLESLAFEVLILEDQPNQGRTVIEKFVAYSDASFAVVVMTPDDVGTTRIAAEEIHEIDGLPMALVARARQNVILELGFFVGRLGRERVVAIVVGSVEIPSDVEGVVYIPFDGAGAWKLRLAAELKAAGFSVDLNRLS